MARIELSNIGGGGTTLSLTTTGTSGASTLAGSVLNIPVYQGQLTLTTTGTSGAATLVGDTLNIPQYSGGGGTPAGSAGQVQFNSTPAGSFAASANLAWDNSNVRLNVGAPSSPTGKLNVKGSGTLTTVNTRLTNSGDTELLKVLDNGSTNIGTAFNWDNTNGRLGINQSTPLYRLHVGSTTNTAAGNPVGFFALDQDAGTSVQVSNANTGSAANSGFYIFGSGGQTGYILLHTAANADPLIAQNLLFETNAGSSTAGMIFSARSSSGSIVFSTNVPRTPRMRIFNNGNVVIKNSSHTDTGYRLQIDGNSATHSLQVIAPNANSGTNALIVQNTTPADLHKIEANGKISYLATNTAAGTTGPQTINRPSGTVNFGIGASSLVVTNSLCTVNSIVFATVRTNDATATIKNVVPAGGSFTINLGAAATAETSVGFFIIN